MFQIVDCRIVQHVTIQILADRPQDLLTKFVALGVQVYKVKLFTDRFQRFGKLRLEQGIQGRLVRSPVTAEEAGYLGDVLRKKVMITGALLFWSSTTALTGLSSGFFSLAMLRSVATGLGSGARAGRGR